MELSEFNFLNASQYCTLVFTGIPNFSPDSVFLNFFYMEPRNILKLFSNIKGVALLEYLRIVFQSLLVLYYIIKLSKNLHFVSIMQKYT